MNHHPDVPSAAGVEKDGVLLDQSNELLLLKVEELTLYMIQTDKEVKALRAEMAAFKRLEKRIRKMKKYPSSK